MFKLVFLWYNNVRSWTRRRTTSPLCSEVRLYRLFTVSGISISLHWAVGVVLIWKIVSMHCDAGEMSVLNTVRSYSRDAHEIWRRNYSVNMIILSMLTKAFIESTLSYMRTWINDWCVCYHGLVWLLFTWTYFIALMHTNILSRWSWFEHSSQSLV